MRIEVRDYNGYVKSISSQNEKVISGWLMEHVPPLMSTNASVYCTINVWPETPEEHDTFRKWGPPGYTPITKEGMKEIGDTFHNIAEGK